MPLKRPRCDTDFSKCILCTNVTSEVLTINPKSFSNLLEKLNTRSKFGNVFYSSIRDRLSGETDTSLREKNATWHRSCYLKLTIKRDIELERSRYSAKVQPRTPIGGDEFESGVFTRSNCSPTNKTYCFFCQKGATKRFKLHKVI